MDTRKRVTYCLNDQCLRYICVF